MKLLFLIGNGAVGKMTVGQELMKITDLRLFHNHMTIEPVIEIFGSYRKDVVFRLRDIIFEEFAASDQYGLIFTYMWAFDQQSNWDYVEHVKKLFMQRKPETEFYYVELVASKEARMQRNATENRLKNKASKNDIAVSNLRLIQDDEKYRLESREGELPFENYLRLDNTNLPPEEAARQIKDYFIL